jgi:hypothetical protein
MNETDEKVRMHLFRKEKTGEVLKMNKLHLDKSLNNMQDYLTIVNNRNSSPRLRNTKN